MGQPLRPLFRLKVEVEARPSAGTGPIAGHLELAAGNGRDQGQFSSARRPRQRLAQPTIHFELLHLDDFSSDRRNLLDGLHVTIPGRGGGKLF